MRHDVELTLRQKEYVSIAAFTAGILLLIFGGGLLLLLLGVAVGLTGVAMQVVWHRCPSCGEHLGRSGFPKFCPHCGKEIDYNAKKS